MEIRYYLDGKIIFSYDNDVFPTDEDYYNVQELFIRPLGDKVYEKYYQKQLVQQVLESILKKDAIVFQEYCNIKPLIVDENLSVEYLDDDETLLKNLMREKLNSAEFETFTELLNKASDEAWKKEMKFLADEGNMKEHFWKEHVKDNK